MPAFFLYLQVSILSAMPENISLKHKIALSLIPGIGDINARKLVSFLEVLKQYFMNLTET